VVTGALAGEQPRILGLVRDSATPSDRKLAHQGGEGLGHSKIVAGESDNRPALLVAHIGDPQPDDANEGLPVEHDQPSGDAIGHAHAVVGHQPAGDRPAMLGVGVGAGRTIRVAGLKVTTPSPLASGTRLSPGPAGVA